MHAGFAMLETGCCRAKNASNVLMKNLVSGPNGGGEVCLLSFLVFLFVVIVFLLFCVVVLGLFGSFAFFRTFLFFVFEVHCQSWLLNGTVILFQCFLFLKSHLGACFEVFVDVNSILHSLCVAFFWVLEFSTNEKQTTFPTPKPFPNVQ